MTLNAGVRLGPYEIVAAIGAGGMGEVYRARDSRLGRDVAVKVLPAAFSSDFERLRRFEQEARAAATLNHPNILAVYDIGEYPATSSSAASPYIVSELLDGQTLRERLTGISDPGPASGKSKEGLPVRKAIEYAIQLAHGLAAAHDKGIIHRDLKPENVFVTRDGRVKILDFGLAKLTQVEPGAVGASDLPTTPPLNAASDSRPGMILGTMGYMSPEQVRGLASDHRSDIFAFGAILYEMLSGQRAFRGATTADTISAILDRDPQDLPVAERHISPALARVVDRCLEKNPSARFQSTHDLAFALEGLSGHSDASTVGALPVPSAARRHRLAWTLAAGGFALVFAVAGLTFSYLRSPANIDDHATRFTIVPPDVSMNVNGVAAVSLAISPDGRQIAYIGAPRTGGAPTLWIRSLDALEGRSLAGTEGAGLPFWSPDNHFIAFFAQGKLKKIDLAGGGPQVLCDAQGGVGGTWSPDGTIIFPSNQGSGLFRVSSAGGQPVAVTTLDVAARESTHRWPFYLPDGRHFLYVAQPNTTVYLASLDSPERKRLLAADSKAIYAAPGYLLFVRLNTLFAQRFDAKRLELVGDALPIAEQLGLNTGAAAGGSAFSASESGELVYRTGSGGAFTGQMTWFDRAGKPIGPVGQPADYRGVELAPDGRRIAAHPHELVGGGDSWLFDLTRGTSSRFTFAGHTLSAIWSPDGTRVAFGSNRPASGQALQDPYAGTFNLYEKRADGTGEPTLLLDAVAAGLTLTYKQPITWSPDGQLLVFEAYDPKTTWDLWALPLSGDRKPRPLVNSEFGEVEGQISPDGRWLAYTSDESKRWEVYVRPLSGGAGKWQISTGGGRFARWRGDSKELFYLTDVPAVRGKMMAVDVAASGSALSVGIPRPLFDAHIANVFFQPTPIGANAKTPFPYVVTRDGQRFLIVSDTTQQAAEAPITVVMNWPASLKK